MNEQIRQLVLHAKIGTADFDAGSYYVATPDRMQKFAELIVRECIEVIDSTSDNTKLMRVEPYQKIIWAIEEHFGVE
jgi:hypothetical protein